MWNKIKKSVRPCCVSISCKSCRIYKKNLKVFAGNIQLNDSRIKESMLVSIVVSVASIHCYHLSASKINGSPLKRQGCEAFFILFFFTLIIQWNDSIRCALCLRLSGSQMALLIGLKPRWHTCIDSLKHDWLLLYRAHRTLRASAAAVYVNTLEISPPAVSLRSAGHTLVYFGVLLCVITSYL